MVKEKELQKFWERIFHTKTEWGWGIWPLKKPKKEKC